MSTFIAFGTAHVDEENASIAPRASSCFGCLSSLRMVACEQFLGKRKQIKSNK